jgi:hypothetical protein
MDGPDVLRLRRIALNLGPQPGDVIVYRPTRWVRIVSPDLVEKLIASYYFARARRQKSQDRKLLARHIEGRAVTAGFITPEVDLNGSEPKFVRQAGARLATAK